MSALSIVFLGLSITSSWGNGHATTYRALVKGLTRRGHRVLFLERDASWYAGHRDLPRPPYGQPVDGNPYSGQQQYAQPQYAPPQYAQPQYAQPSGAPRANIYRDSNGEPYQPRPRTLFPFD